MTSVQHYVFTVFTGRGGGAQTTAFLNRTVSGCWAANEFPEYVPTLPGRLGRWQHRFHRRFIETHELLGRGEVIKAFVRGDDDYIEKVARRRMKLIEEEADRRGATIYIDVTKFFARGLHRGIIRTIPRFSLLFMARNPLTNMRSFLNRRKNFLLDNNRPGDSCNVLRLNDADMEKGELYLWMWCELHLRFQELARLPNVERTATIRTEAMNDADAWRHTLDELHLPHLGIEIAPPPNRNVTLGYGETQVSADDARLFERFVQRIPVDVRRRLTYLDDFDPWQSVEKTQGSTPAPTTGAVADQLGAAS